MSVDFNRRSFFKGAMAAGAALSVPNFVARAAQTVEALVMEAPPLFTSWDDIYRSKWTWDKVVRGTHIVNCWYQAHCAWDVYVKDDLVFREEQAGEYEQVNEELPDFNPRGCQKGACFSERMYDATRLRYPLRRVGKRGSGRWERVSWEEAMDDIADNYIDIIREESTDRVILDVGPNIDFGTAAAGLFRFGKLSRAIALDMNTEIGDGHRGAAETFGKMIGDRSADDYFYSDLILMWSCNPIYTQIPQAHFYLEARYRGAKIITITPDYNASSVHADLWVPVKPGTDAALALAVCHLLIEQDNIDHDFVREQTDMPFLVRMDNRKFLMESDLRADGDVNRHLMFDANSDRLAQAPWRDLNLSGIAPSLEYQGNIALADGTPVEVRTVFSLLRERLAEYTPENASQACGVSPNMIRRLAKEIAQAGTVANVTSSNISKYYHGNLIERSLILIFALTGQFGKKGGGYSAFPFLTIEGTDRFSILDHMGGWREILDKLAPMMQQRIEAGDTQEMIVYDMTRTWFQPGVAPEGIEEPKVTCAALFWAVHADLTSMSDKTHDPFMRRTIQEHLKESLENGWQSVVPKAGDDPKMMITVSSNPLRRIRGGDKVLKNFWPKLKLSVVMDFRMNSTTKYADYVLPCAAWYERTTHKWVTTLSPYITMTNAAVKPLGESKTDWAIFALLAKHIQKRAKERGLSIVRNQYGETVRLDSMYDEFTMQGQFKEADDEKVMKAIFDLSTNVDIDYEELKEKGFARYKGVGEHVMSAGNMCEIPEDDSITHYTYHTRDKMPYPTATRRIQFYLDQALYHELDEVLPRHKAPPEMGGKYPLMMTGGHPRESIHATWRDSKLMLQLHRGEPFILMSPNDAEQRGIKDTDWVNVYNDVGNYHVRVKIAPGIQDGQVLIYHAWENHQFRKGSPRDVLSAPLNPVELSGGYGHLQPVYAWSQPSFFDRDTRIEVVKLDKEAVGR